MLKQNKSYADILSEKDSSLEELNAYFAGFPLKGTEHIPATVPIEDVMVLIYHAMSNSWKQDY